MMNSNDDLASYAQEVVTPKPEKINFLEDKADHFD
jgi:hypothetical protein